MSFPLLGLISARWHVKSRTRNGMISLWLAGIIIIRLIESACKLQRALCASCQRGWLASSWRRLAPTRTPSAILLRQEQEPPPAVLKQVASISLFPPEVNISPHAADICQPLKQKLSRRTLFSRRLQIPICFC
jgi:hypothetical protein